jgi:hypothetical protein
MTPKPVDLPPPNCVRKPERKIVAGSCTAYSFWIFSVSSAWERERQPPAKTLITPSRCREARGWLEHVPWARSAGLGAARPGSRGKARASEQACSRRVQISRDGREQRGQAATDAAGG